MDKCMISFFCYIDILYNPSNDKPQKYKNINKGDKEHENNSITK